MKRRDALRRALKGHQAKAVEWARRRIRPRPRSVEVPHGTRGGSSRNGQIGVTLADGVGLGKTWEALAAAARLIADRKRRRRSGQRRRRNVRSPVRILVLVPPGLVAKWRDELHSEERGFRKALRKWARGSSRREFVLRTFRNVIDLRSRLHLGVGGKVATKRRWHRRTIDGGVYIANVNLFAHGTSAYRGPGPAKRMFNERWDAVIVDEAHHRASLRALSHFRCLRTPPHPAVLLLSATPFQLSPGDLRYLFNVQLLRSHDGDSPGHGLLRSPPLKPFMSAVAAACKNPAAAAPRPAERRNAQRILGQLVARSVRSGRGRTYWLIDDRGEAVAVRDPARWTDADFGAQLPRLIAPDREFERHYVRVRIRLAETDGGTFVPAALQQLLSSHEQFRGSAAGTLVRKSDVPARHPKVEAVVAWFRRTLSEDIDRVLGGSEDIGRPRKSIVFIRYVGGTRAGRHGRGTRRVLLDRLSAAAHGVFASKITDRAAFRRRTRDELAGLERLVADETRDIDRRRTKPLRDACKHLRDLAKHAEGHPHLVALLGHPKGAYRDRLRSDLRRELREFVSDVAALESPASADDELQRSARLRAVRDTARRMRRWFQPDFVAAYTGVDSDRDYVGDRFRGPWFPWVLVASNVGAEGIDLQTYTSHLVHYEIEWNPARMEQREGRGDRLGRRLKSRVKVYFPLVAKTYEERMLHQMVARMRWHGVLLGKAGVDLVRDEGRRVYRRTDPSELARLQLDLTPRLR